MGKNAGMAGGVASQNTVKAEGEGDKVRLGNANSTVEVEGFLSRVRQNSCCQ